MKRKIVTLTLILTSILILIFPGCKTKTMSWSNPPAMTIDQSKSYTATIKTNYGDIIVNLFPKDAPLTVNNFVFLSRQGFYDGLKFHRIVAGFVLQGGDPTGTGSGGPGYQFKDEIINKPYSIGTLAMANSGPNTNGSQFFICLADLTNQTAAFQKKAYNIFGIVTSGMDIVRKISNVPVNANDSPTTDVYITTITIEEK
jgi:cyclophilin family peptidyl-prolyl cis-trans isomerase